MDSAIITSTYATSLNSGTFLFKHTKSVIYSYSDMIFKFGQIRSSFGQVDSVMQLPESQVPKKLLSSPKDVVCF